MQSGDTRAPDQYYGNDNIVKRVARVYKEGFVLFGKIFSSFLPNSIPTTFTVEKYTRDRGNIARYWPHASRIGSTLIMSLFDCFDVLYNDIRYRGVILTVRGYLYGKDRMLSREMKVCWGVFNAQCCKHESIDAQLLGLRLLVTFFRVRILGECNFTDIGTSKYFLPYLNISKCNFAYDFRSTWNCSNNSHYSSVKSKFKHFQMEFRLRFSRAWKCSNNSHRLNIYTRVLRVNSEYTRIRLNLE